MEDKDIEKLLKESADEVEVKDFSERWEKLKGRMNSAQEVELEETTSETVLATSANGNLSQNSIKKKFIISLSAVFLFIAICLAIVLPITLRTNDSSNEPPMEPPRFLNLRELKNEGVSGNEFYNKIAETDLKTVDIKKFEASNFSLFYTTENELVGGGFEVVDEVDGIFATVIFYDATVTSSFEIGEDNKSCNVNGYNIEYKTGLDEEELFLTKAKATNDSISYELECLSLDENIENFFNKLFG